MKGAGGASGSFATESGGFDGGLNFDDMFDFGSAAISSGSPIAAKASGLRPARKRMTSGLCCKSGGYATNHPHTRAFAKFLITACGDSRRWRMRFIGDTAHEQASLSCSAAFELRDRAVSHGVSLHQASHVALLQSSFLLQTGCTYEYSSIVSPA